MLFRQITDPVLAQYAYLIGCQRTGEAIVFDPERDIDRYLDIAKREGLRIVATMRNPSRLAMSRYRSMSRSGSNTMASPVRWQPIR